MTVIGYATMEIIRETRRYTIDMPIGSQFSECLDVLEEAKANLLQMIENAKVASESSDQSAEVKPEEVVAELV